MWSLSPSRDLRLRVVVRVVSSGLFLSLDRN
jgi:hypothetical protein